MSRQSTALVLMLLAVIGVQAWFLYQAKDPAKPISLMQSESTATTERVSDATSTGNTQAVMNHQLARIDARLAALEVVKSHGEVAAEQKIVLGSHEALAADKKIAALLPREPITHQELILFQAQLAQYPPSEQFQLSAALARAINNGQLQFQLRP